MTAVLFSLLPLIGWGIGDYVASKMSKKIDGYTLSFFYALSGFALTVPIALTFGAPTVYASSVFYFFCASIFVNSGFLMLVRGFKYGPAGIVAPIANAYAIISTAAAILILKDEIMPKTLVGIAVVVTGIALVSYSKPKPGEFKDVRKTFQSALASLLLFGVGFFFFDKAAVQDWNQNHVLFECISVSVACLIWVIMQKKHKIKQFKKSISNPAMYIGGLAGSTGLMGMFAAVEISGSVAIPAAVGAAAPLMTAFLAYKLDNEHLTTLQRLATVIIVAGIVLLSI